MRSAAADALARPQPRARSRSCEWTERGDRDDPEEDGQRDRREIGGEVQDHEAERDRDQDTPADRRETAQPTRDIRAGGRRGGGRGEESNAASVRSSGASSYLLARPTMPPTRARSTGGSMTDTTAALEAHLDATHAERMASYTEFLRIPSISALPVHAPDCRRAADWLAEAMRSAGIEHVEVAETGGHPVVYGDWLHAAGAPTVLVYGHYDVQPVDPLDQWTSPPFEPVVEGRSDAGARRGGRQGPDPPPPDGRGRVARDARRVPGQRAVPVRGRGGVELDPPRRLARGQPRAARRRRRGHQRQRLLRGQPAGDHDGPARASCTPRSTCGIAVDLHSGGYGGDVENPANALARIIAALKGPDGRILIPGFYDEWSPLTDGDRAAFAALPFDEAAYAAAIGVPALVGEVGYTALERRGRGRRST